MHVVYDRIVRIVRIVTCTTRTMIILVHSQTGYATA